MLTQRYPGSDQGEPITIRKVSGSKAKGEAYAIAARSVGWRLEAGADLLRHLKALRQEAPERDTPPQDVPPDALFTVRPRRDVPGKPDAASCIASARSGFLVPLPKHRGI